MSRPLIALAAVAVLAGGVPALAQQAPGPQQQPDLSQALHLRPDQQGAYRNMMAAQQPRPDEIAAFRAASPQVLGSLRTPDRLNRINAAQNASLQLFHRNADATRAFYSALSPDQQRTFDQLSAPPQQQQRQRRPGY